MYRRYYDSYPSRSYMPDNGEVIVPDSAYTVQSAVKEEAEPQSLPPPTENITKECSTANNIAEENGTAKGVLTDEVIALKPDAAAEDDVKTAGLGKGLFSSIQFDDILLIALLFLLLSESPDDIIMPIIIGYLLLGDVLPI